MKNTINKFTPAQQEIIWDLKQQHLDYMDNNYKRPEQIRSFQRYVERFHPAHTELADQCRGIKLLEWRHKEQTYSALKQPA